MIIITNNILQLQCPSKAISKIFRKYSQSMSQNLKAAQDESILKK